MAACLYWEDKALNKARPQANNSPENKSTRQKILDSATKLFATKGYTETSIRELAAAVGVREAAIYNHFPSKNAILKCILNEFTQNSNDFFAQEKMGALHDTLKNNPTADGIVSSLRLSFPKGKEKYYLELLYVILQEQHRNLLVRKFISEEYILAAEDAVRTIIGQLKKIKKLRPDTDPDFWAKIYSSLLYTFASRMMLGIGDQEPGFSGLDMREMIWQMFDLLLKTCGPEKT